MQLQSGSRPTSSRPAASPVPKPPHQVNTQTKVLDTHHGRLLCVADIRGRLSNLNDLAREADAKAIIHTGDFGFFEANSLDRINDRTLRHLTQYSPLIPNAQRAHLLAPENPPSVIRSTVNISLLSEFPLLLSGQIKLQVPVFTLWGACEDVQVLEKFRAGTYAIDNLHIIDEATTRCLDVGGIKLRLLGLGGALVPHKMFDNGEGNATIAGGQGTMWITALQIGELVDTAQRVFDPSETRLLLTHASPGREGLIAQLALVLKADLTVSAGLHFRYGSSYNEFSVQADFEGFRHKLAIGKEAFDRVWEHVKSQVNQVIDEPQRVLLDKFLALVDRIPSAPNATQAAPNYLGEEAAWKNCWNWNLCDAAYGSLVLDIKDGRVNAELKSQGFNYAYRRTATPSQPATAGTPQPTSATPEKAIPAHVAPKSLTPAPKSASPAPASAAAAPPSGPGTPAPATSASPAPNNNGNGTALTPPPTDKAKAAAKKEKQKERRDRPDGRATPVAEAPKSGKGTPVPDALSSDVGEPETPASPAPDGGSSTGAQTPTSRRPARNPWTLFVRMENGASEEKLREFFGEAKDGIVRINYPPSFLGKAQKIAYVEFGDEEAMKAGLEKHAEKIDDQSIDVKIAQSPEERMQNGEFRGRGRGRGGRGGNFAARGFASAGLTRGGAPSPKPNGA